MTTILATAADERYGDHLLNLIGSVRANSDLFDGIVAYDLGLSARQRVLLGRVRGVDVRIVPPFVPHWAQGRTWKAWIWTHAECERLLWLDAGLTVLRPLDHGLERIDANGYFAVSQGHPLGDSIPEEWYTALSVPREIGRNDSIAAGIFGFARASDFYDRVVVPVYEDCVRGLSLGFSPDEVTGRNTGLDYTDVPVLRNCKHFRWDQSVLNVRFYLGVDRPVVDDLARFAGWRSAHEHPQQVIWSHRRTGDLRYLTQVPYAEDALVGRLFGFVLRARWWRKRHERLLSPTTYRLKAAALWRSLRSGSR